MWKLNKSVIKYVYTTRINEKNILLSSKRNRIAVCKRLLIEIFI